MASVAHVEEWTDACASVAEIEAALADLRSAHAHGGEPDLMTSVLTHIAWVPPEWQEAATETLSGMGERHPSRTLLLFPQPGDSDELAARVLLECYDVAGLEQHLCSEVVELRLQGARAEAPASIVVPLLLPDLPVFLRWRGRPDFGSPVVEQLLGIVDRLVVDSSEWDDVPAAYRELKLLFDRVVASDIAWRRTLPWRRALASAWPELPDRLTGPPAETALVTGWLRSRAGIDVATERADELPMRDDQDPSDVLSDELDVFVRDRVYEAAVSAARPEDRP
ncbi:MAG TPA: glucose-6-phosphate dehydrogenase assembly protein OpcA [Gaiellaceae bacterium]|nr:glucose-6-phosphate dehydrogenase assembly protein OpcA [Gaiellaceae bacterium]